MKKFLLMNMLFFGAVLASEYSDVKDRFDGLLEQYEQNPDQLKNANAEQREKLKQRVKAAKKALDACYEEEAGKKEARKEGYDAECKKYQKFINEYVRLQSKKEEQQPTANFNPKDVRREHLISKNQELLKKVYEDPESYFTIISENELDGLCKSSEDVFRAAYKKHMLENICEDLLDQDYVKDKKQIKQAEFDKLTRLEAEFRELQKDKNSPLVYQCLEDVKGQLVPSTLQLTAGQYLLFKDLLATTDEAGLFIADMQDRPIMHQILASIVLGKQFAKKALNAVHPDKNLASAATEAQKRQQHNISTAITNARDFCRQLFVHIEHNVALKERFQDAIKKGIANDGFVWITQFNNGLSKLTGGDSEFKGSDVLVGTVVSIFEENLPTTFYSFVDWVENIIPLGDKELRDCYFDYLKKAVSSDDVHIANQKVRVYIDHLNYTYVRAPGKKPLTFAELMHAKESFEKNCKLGLYGDLNARLLVDKIVLNGILTSIDEQILNLQIKDALNKDKQEYVCVYKELYGRIVDAGPGLTTGVGLGGQMSNDPRLATELIFLKNCGVFKDDEELGNTIQFLKKNNLADVVNYFFRCGYEYAFETTQKSFAHYMQLFIEHNDAKKASIALAKIPRYMVALQVKNERYNLSDTLLRELVAQVCHENKDVKECFKSGKYQARQLAYQLNGVFPTLNSYNKPQHKLEFPNDDQGDKAALLYACGITDGKSIKSIIKTFNDESSLKAAITFFAEYYRANNSPITLSEFLSHKRFKEDDAGINTASFAEVLCYQVLDEHILSNEEHRKQFFAGLKKPDFVDKKFDNISLNQSIVLKYFNDAGVGLAAKDINNYIDSSSDAILLKKMIDDLHGYKKYNNVQGSYALSFADWLKDAHKIVAVQQVKFENPGLKSLELLNNDVEAYQKYRKSVGLKGLCFSEWQKVPEQLAAKINNVQLNDLRSFWHEYSKCMIYEKNSVVDVLDACQKLWTSDQETRVVMQKAAASYFALQKKFTKKEQTHFVDFCQNYQSTYNHLYEAAYKLKFERVPNKELREKLASSFHALVSSVMITYGIDDYLLRNGLKIALKSNRVFLNILDKKNSDDIVKDLNEATLAVDKEVLIAKTFNDYQHFLNQNRGVKLFGQRYSKKNYAGFSQKIKKIIGDDSQNDQKDEKVGLKIKAAQLQMFDQLMGNHKENSYGKPFSRAFYNNYLQKTPDEQQKIEEDLIGNKFTSQIWKMRATSPMYWGHQALQFLESNQGRKKIIEPCLSRFVGVGLYQAGILPAAQKTKLQLMKAQTNLLQTMAAILRENPQAFSV